MDGDSPAPDDASALGRSEQRVGSRSGPSGRSNWPKKQKLEGEAASRSKQVACKGTNTPWYGVFVERPPPGTEEEKAGESHRFLSLDFNYFAIVLAQVCRGLKPGEVLDTGTGNHAEL